MSRKSKSESQVERDHGHCADVLMSDYGIPEEMRKEVCDEVAKLWKQNTMIHCMIIASVRGWQPLAATRGLEHFLASHQTHAPKHQKPGPGTTRAEGHFDSKGFYHQSNDPYADW